MDIAQTPDITEYGYSQPLEMSKVSTWGWFNGDQPEDQEIVNHTARALDLFIEQFEEKDVLQGNEASLLTPYQPMESTLQDMKFQMLNIDSTGNRLDIIGEIVGVERKGRNDDDYRNAIILQIAINTSNGEPEVVRKVAIALTGATQVKLTESFPAGIDLLITTIFSIPSDLIDQLEKVASSGVRLRIFINDIGDDFAFSGEGGYPPEPDTLGFGETGVGLEDEGGKFVEWIT